MKYEKIIKGQFVSRPNRFVADVKLNHSGEITRAHVKNTGRCRELLLPGSTVYLEDFTDRMGTRKMTYSLIGVEKVLPDGQVLMINMDSQAPNKVTAEALASGKIILPGMGRLTEIRGEKTYGDSRFDFYVGDENGRRGFIEVKGVTLEDGGLVRFPDAPTERGVKHLRELMKARAEGYMAYALFIVQMEGMRLFMPNDDTHPAFGDTLREAAEADVGVLAYQCHVTEDTLEVTCPLEVRLTT
jgi:sugar fermentation stimulation protein A